ncbi:ATP synthase subunit I [uncultured Xylophilus sp.]|uniref:ATP synthase subunit I n=1 Tax=uncultured Xylophilus sp. TaxID=296832 RepID=UPI0025E6B0E6|nr:ATP synthase subunit I [uncultured Xylophilus sp.]
MKPDATNDDLEAQESEFKPLTAEEAQRLMSRHPQVSPWRVIAGQMCVGVLAALAAWALTGQARMAWSTAWGAAAVVIPAAVFARGLTRSRSAANPGVAAAGFLGWEIVKIVLTIALLAMSPRVVPGLSWLALLAGMVLTMKAYWIAFLPRRKARGSAVGQEH